MARFLDHILLGLVILATSASLCFGSTALRGSVGIGLFGATDTEYYESESDFDPYGEAGLAIDFSGLRFGCTCGAIYKQQLLPGSEWWEERYTTIAFLPVQAELLMVPFAGRATRSARHLFPYFGFAGGMFVPVGDNQKYLPAGSVVLGGERYLDRMAVYCELRYTLAPDQGRNAGGVFFLVGLGMQSWR
jgi:hypothetical protein